MSRTDSCSEMTMVIPRRDARSGSENAVSNLDVVADHQRRYFDNPIGGLHSSSSGRKLRMHL